MGVVDTVDSYKAVDGSVTQYNIMKVMFLVDGKTKVISCSYGEKGLHRCITKRYSHIMLLCVAIKLLWRNTKSKRYYEMSDSSNDKENELMTLQDNLGRPDQLTDATPRSLSVFKYNAERESDTHFRVSNFAIKALMSLSPDSWRMFSTISEQLDLHPNELINDEEFLRKFSEGKATIPSHFRTITIKASQYEKRWLLPKGSAYRTFTLDALTLFEDSLASSTFLGEDLVRMELTRPVTSIQFIVQAIQDGSKVNKLFGPESLVRPSLLSTKEHKINIESGFWQAKEIKFLLNENLFHTILMVQQYFTRIEKKPTTKLSKLANKLFAILSLMSDINRPLNETWVFTLTLNEVNTALKLTAKSIPVAFKSLSTYCEELTAKTNFNVVPEKDPLTKDGNKFTQVVIHFSEKTTPLTIEQPKKVTRKLIPRPRVAVCSMEEKEWVKNNLHILMDYELRLKQVNKKLPSIDVKRVKRYKEILGDSSF